MNNNFPIKVKNGTVIDTYMTDIEKILHSKKIKYSKLKPLIDTIDIEGETVNLYIDLFDVIKQLYQPNIINDFKTMKGRTKMSIVAELVNIVGHYRHFFYKYYDKYTTVIMYYSSMKDDYLTKIDPKYKEKFYSTRLLNENPEYYPINKTFNDCLAVVKEYLQYIPHAYLIDTEKTDPRLLPYIITNKTTSEDFNGRIDPNEFSILLTSNNADLINLLYNKNMVILRNIYKRDGQHYPVLVNSKNDIYKQLKLDDGSIMLSDLYLKNLFIISGNNDYGITNIDKMREKKAYKLLAKSLIEGSDITKLTNSLGNQFKTNRLLVDFDTYPVNDLKKYNIIKHFIDIQDFEYIKQETFNDFEGSYIILFDYLFDGEEVS